MTNQEIQILLDSKTFAGFDRDSILIALNCLNSRTEIFSDSVQLFKTGDKVTYAPFILTGSIEVSIINEAGNKFMMTRFQQGDLIAAAININHLKNNSMDIRTHGTTKLLMLDLSQLFRAENNTCQYKTILLQNMLGILSSKIMFLQQKFQTITQKSLRDKILNQFNLLSIKQDNKTIILPYTREEFAQSICADRSAVSRELNKMQNEKVIRIEKNQITIY